MSRAEGIRNRKEFEDRIRELTATIRERAVVFPNDTADQQLARIKEAKCDPLYFARTYFPHYVTAEFADFHEEEMRKAAEALDGDESQIIAEIWFRGGGKSSLLAIILPIWAAVTGKVMFTIHVGADRELSKERTVAIRLEYQHNARLRHDYPEIAMDEGIGEETDFNTPTNVRYRAQGYRQTIRGKMNGPHRPRLIIVDDLEGHTDTNPRIARQKYEFVTEEAFGAFGEKGGVLIWLGNLTNSQSALNQFVKKCEQEPDNRFVRVRAVRAVEDGKSAWESAYPLKKLEAIQAVIGKHGFDRHYLMKPGIDGDVFKEDWLLQYNPHNRWNQELAGKIKNVGINIVLPSWEDLQVARTVTYCDPSLGGGETNDYKAIVTLAQFGGLYYVVDICLRRMSILDMLDYMYQVDKRFRTRHFMESNFWQKIIWQFLPQKAEEYEYMLPVSGVESRLKKEERILMLEPLYQWGHIINCTVGDDWEQMKEQLVGFPHAEYDDGPDALAGAVAQFRVMSQVVGYESLQRRGNVGMF